MPDIQNTAGGTIFNPSPAEVLANNRNKQQRREHKAMMEDIVNIKIELLSLQQSSKAKARSIRKSKGGY